MNFMAGYLCNLEQPEAFTQQVRAFVSFPGLFGR